MVGQEVQDTFPYAGLEADSIYHANPRAPDASDDVLAVSPRLIEPCLLEVLGHLRRGSTCNPHDVAVEGSVRAVGGRGAKSRIGIHAPHHPSPTTPICVPSASPGLSGSRVAVGSDATGVL